MSILLEVLEWMDPTNQEMIFRMPPVGSADIKAGAQLIVRDSQEAIFFKSGKVADKFSAGRYTLTSKNIPILTQMLSLPWGFTSPFRCEVYFFNLKTFTNLRWGTREPVVFYDKKLGVIRLKGYGTYTLRITDPILMLNTLVGRMGRYTTGDITDFLRDISVSRLNDFLGEQEITLTELPGQYQEIGEAITLGLRKEFAQYGLELKDFFVSAITPTDQVADAIDRRTSMEAAGDPHKYMQYEMARGLGSNNAFAGGAGLAAGMGAGVGLLGAGVLPKQSSGTANQRVTVCSHCSGECSQPDAKFCPHCGNSLAAALCKSCQRPLIANAQFCSNCGTKADDARPSGG